jgi:hypothetical protein
MVALLAVVPCVYLLLLALDRLVGAAHRRHARERLRW